MKLNDKKIKEFARKSARKRPRGKCPDDLQLAAFLEGNLNEQDRESVGAHLGRCPECLSSVRVLRKILAEPEKEREIRVPVAVLERARKLDPARKGAIELVIRFGKKAAEIVKMSGGVVGGLVPATDMVRGQGQVVSDTLVTFTKQFEPYLAEIEVEKTKLELGEITIKLTDEKSRGPAEGLRISLYQQDNELESNMLDSGCVVFENIKFGKYRIEITKVGEPLAGIALEMKGEGK